MTPCTRKMQFWRPRRKIWDKNPKKKKLEIFQKQIFVLEKNLWTKRLQFWRNKKNSDIRPEIYRSLSKNVEKSHFFQNNILFSNCPFGYIWPPCQFNPTNDPNVSLNGRKQKDEKVFFSRKRKHFSFWKSYCG